MNALRLSIILSLLTTVSLQAADTFYQRMTLVSKEQQEFSVFKRVACISNTIANLLAPDTCFKESTENKIHFHELNSDTLSTLISSLELLNIWWHQSKVYIPPLLQPKIDQLTKDKTVEQLEALLMGANFLDVPHLLNAYAYVMVRKASEDEFNKMYQRISSCAGLMPIKRYLDKHMVLKLNHIKREKSVADAQIDETWAIKIKSLDLAGLRLTSLFGLDQLNCTGSIENLKFHESNYIFDHTVDPQFPDQPFAGFTQLKCLYFCMNQLGTLPKDLCQLTKLKRLILFSNKLTSLPQEIKQLTKLRELRLHNNRLEQLPDEIKHLTRLRWLTLSSNKLRMLPKGMKQLSQLDEIWLNHNQLSSLPKGMERLTSMTKLELNNNNFSRLPKWFMRLGQLQELYLSCNAFTRCPRELKWLTALRALAITDNGLLNVSRNIQYLKQLQRLYLSGNKLKTIPPEIGLLEQLQKLDLERNQLETLPREIGALSSLQELNLSHNALRCLPESMQRLTQLQKLFLHHNALSDLPTGLQRLTQLKKLNLEHNEFALQKIRRLQSTDIKF